MDEAQQTVAAGGPAADPTAARARARRDFLRSAGLGGAALALAACGGGGVERALLAPGTPTSPSPAVIGPGGSVTLDFSNEIDVLNYAYALEQLEAAFYIRVTNAPQFATIFAANEQRILRDLRAHEVVHRDFFAAAIPAAERIPALTPDFSRIDFGSRASVLAAARDFEDLGVSAYNGAGRYLKTNVYLTLAGKIVSVEARHASAIRDVLSPNTGDFAPSPYDAPKTPQEVLAAADPFIVEPITAVNT
jgi:hypothetical protein